MGTDKKRIAAYVTEETVDKFKVVSVCRIDVFIRHYADVLPFFENLTL